MNKTAGQSGGGQIMTSQPLRFVINGLLATAVNYLTLITLIECFLTPYVGAAALASAMVGILASFIGNRFFVFQSTAPVLRELLRFKALYAGIALFQGLFMTIWSDVFSHDYNIGFVLVTGASIFISYFGAKHAVFQQAST